MRRELIFALVLPLALAGCGRQQEERAPEPAPAQEAPAPAAEAPHAPMRVVSDVSLDDAVRAAWRGARIKVVDGQTGNSTTYDLEFGAPTALGDTGLTATALVFVPDFVMDENGITTRSPEPNNPALKVRIEEAGKEPFEGWLFAAMPEIHPYPHERYQVLLVEGIPAGE